MKWNKLGKIFDPTEHELPNGCLEFAQSPQALVLADRVRVYFSTRNRDQVGKYLSHIAYVDFAKNMREILDVAKHTVIELEGLAPSTSMVFSPCMFSMTAGECLDLPRDLIERSR